MFSAIKTSHNRGIPETYCVSCDSWQVSKWNHRQSKAHKAAAEPHRLLLVAHRLAMRSLRETPPPSSEPPSDPPPEMNPAAKPIATPAKAIVKATPTAAAAKPIVKPIAALVKPVAAVVKPVPVAVPVVEVKSAEPNAVIEPIPAAKAVVVEEAAPALVEASLAALTIEEAAPAIAEAVEPAAAPEAAPSVLDAYLVIAPDLPPSIWKQIGARLTKQNAALSLTIAAEAVDTAIIVAAIAKARDAYVLKRERARISSSARRAAKKLVKQETDDAPEAEAAPLETPTA